jgi:hypothetical protein
MHSVAKALRFDTVTLHRELYLESLQSVLNPILAVGSSKLAVGSAV